MSKRGDEIRRFAKTQPATLDVTYTDGTTESFDLQAMLADQAKLEDEADAFLNSPIGKMLLDGKNWTQP